MNDSDAADILSALGNEKRLQVFRLLVRAGRDGMNVGDIQLRTAILDARPSHRDAHPRRPGLPGPGRPGNHLPGELRNHADRLRFHD